jgi:hypothetical protein
VAYSCQGKSIPTRIKSEKLLQKILQPTLQNHGKRSKDDNISPFDCRPDRPGIRESSWKADVTRSSGSICLPYNRSRRQKHSKSKDGMDVTWDIANLNIVEENHDM